MTRRSLVLENAIIEARKGGATIAAIAKLVHRSKRMIVYVLTTAGLTKRIKPNSKLNDEAIEQLRALRAQGVRVKALAAQFGTSRITVWKHTKRKGDQHEQRIS